jgi:molybdate transport system substrate-binding protein
LTLAARLLFAVAMSVALVACGGESASVATSGPQSAAPNAAASPASVEPAPLLILGAASMRGALDKIKAAWEGSHARSTLTISTDSSAALETQIEQGAPADVFLSADPTNPGKLVDKGLADGAPVSIAGNVLTIVVPTANPAAIRTPFDLAKPGVKIIAAGDDVPVTKYADQVVANLAKEPGAPPEFAVAYAANVVSKEDNVKAVIAKVELGEGDAAIVYMTDARASTKATTIPIPDAANVPATYAGVVLKESAHPAAAHAFLEWLAGPDGQAILKAFGFLPTAD